MKIYVASSWRNDKQPAVVLALRDDGHEVYDFRHPHLGPGRGGGGFRWSEIDPAWQEWPPWKFRDALQHPVAVDGYESDLAGMLWAEIGVLVTPSGKSSHLELGYMAGSGKPTLILLSDGEPELMYRMATYLCVDLADARAVLADLSSEMEEQAELDKIDRLTREEMCRLHRFAPAGHPYFVVGTKLSAAFDKRFGELGRFTSEISKRIGWDQP